MAVGLAQARVDFSGSATTASASLGSSPTAGNIIVAVHGVGQPSSTTSVNTPSTGWTAIEQKDTTNGVSSINIWARIVAAGESSTYTFNNGGNTQSFLHIYEISGASSTIAAAIPATNHSSTNSSTTTSITNSSISPTSGLSAYIISGIFWTSGGTSAQSVDSGLSAHVAASNRGASADLAIASTSGSYSVGWSWTTSRPPTTIQVIVQADASISNTTGILPALMTMV